MKMASKMGIYSGLKVVYATDRAGTEAHTRYPLSVIR
jgi:hypothetical protein